MSAHTIPHDEWLDQKRDRSVMRLVAYVTVDHRRYDESGYDAKDEILKALEGVDSVTEVHLPPFEGWTTVYQHQAEDAA